MAVPVLRKGFRFLQDDSFHLAQCFFILCGQAGVGLFQAMLYQSQFVTLHSKKVGFWEKISATIAPIKRPTEPLI